MHEFSDSEIQLVRDLLTRRYHRDVEIQLGQSDLGPGGEGGEPTPCATVLWYAGGGRTSWYTKQGHNDSKPAISIRPMNSMSPEPPGIPTSKRALLQYCMHSQIMSGTIPGPKSLTEPGKWRLNRRRPAEPIQLSRIQVQ